MVSPSCPKVIEWLTLTGVVLKSLPHRHDLKRSIAKPFIPFGVSHFRQPGGEWVDIKELPKEWGLPLPGDLSQVSAAVEEEGFSENELRSMTESIWRSRKKREEQQKKGRLF